MLDAIVISDIHLGSENCQAKYLAHFLHTVRRGDLKARHLVLNGDVFDSIDFRRLKKNHWKILSELRKLADEMEVVWINGNHDGTAEVVSHLLGVRCADETVVESGGRKILFLHGHRFDEFITRYPFITWVADRVYNFLQKIDQSHTFAKFAKRRSKTFLRCAQKIEADAVKYAAKRGCDVVCCGHTHLPVANETGPIRYYNSGCWTEKPCHYLTVANGVVKVCSYTEEVSDEVLNTIDPPALAPAVLASVA
ncbi:UDP-2,3-diacylglucosamine diphosphatase [Gemmata sp. JC717]|uniref:UDP-2,3-diacylglucosamine diphosphatase n=1 Tax=Gemmata algarum TaxID=2975278 RepID=A0ABU5EYS8_9BACT|nr:UDP-2,3-diacylglucosamine diphosphatase [Gemmata algarum]MDY3551577.1 UDP-2,3-diacylglucosamine diphosphatase [Gemmata algarum]MDY3560463.1 UDP-2,3-diacylglucosamine diphosphatase [Gemmata algarum]